jgi:hypothetical protein
LSRPSTPFFMAISWMLGTSQHDKVVAKLRDISTARVWPWSRRSTISAGASSHPSSPT